MHMTHDPCELAIITGHAWVPLQSKQGTTTTKLLLLEDCCSDKWDTFINMDKSWMGTNRTNKSYVDGVAAFIDYAVHNLQKMGNIDLRVNKQHLLMPCPCTKCLNHIEHKVEEVQFHLFRNGIDLSYTKWNKHGEKDEPSISAPKPVNATTEFVDDTDFALDIPTDGPATVEMVNATKDNFDEDDLVKFQELLLDAEKPLYEGYSQAWRTIDETFPKIAEDPRNLRLGISDDGVDINTRTRHHKPLVDDLHTLFETWVDTYDASIKYNFILRAIVLWTINDYPTLGTLCGCPYSGFKGCVQKKAFNGQQEFLLAPNLMTGEQIYNEVQHIENKWGKGKRTNNKASENQEETRGRGKKIQKQKRNTTEEEGSSSQVNGQNNAYWMKFNICKEIILQELDKMQAELVVTLCLLEKFFPLSFFDIMVHLTVHLTREVKLCGPICFQWMYPLERCMKVIKGHVQNKNRPEGCIAKETIAEETIEFFSEYHKSMETIGIPPDKHETVENEEGKPLLAGKSSEVSAKLFQKAHFYVIQNTDELVLYIEVNLSYKGHGLQCLQNNENMGTSIPFQEIPLSKYDWVNSRAGGVKRDNLSLHIAFASALPSSITHALQIE
ncbi:putative ribonuclease H-like domain-containing protein [Tanacetum coccineum]